MTPEQRKAIRARCEVAEEAGAMLHHTVVRACLNEIERLRGILETVTTKHNLLKQLAAYEACKCRGSELCMKHGAADILFMINDELT